MHRATFVPQFLCWSVVLGLVCQAGFFVGTAWAQGPAPEPGLVPEPSAKTIPLTLGDTKQIQMSKGQLITNVRVENPKIIQAAPDPANPRLVLVTALSPGKTRIHLTDDQKNTEALDLYIPSGREGRMKQFMEASLARFNELVLKAVPTAAVQAHLAGETVILTGTVPDPETIPIIMELARGVFRDPEGAEELSRLVQPAGGQPVPAQPGGLPPAQPREITQLTTRQRLVIINALRVGGVQQVQLEVIVARVSRSERRQMSFSWMNHGNGHTIGNNLLSPLMTSVNNPVYRIADITNLHGVTTTNANAVLGIVSDAELQSFQGFLQALRNEGLVKLMAEPKLVTLSGKPAYFLAGGEQAVPTVSGFGGTAGVEFRPFGTQITFLPIVMGSGKIYLEVQPVVNRLDPSAGVTIPGGGLVPGRATQQVRTAVTLEDGETFAIGGLVQNAVEGSTSKVPILGDLPFFGTLFRTVDYNEVEEELIILVTPRLVDPLACDQLPKVLPGRETRSPDDFELFLEGILEAPRGCRRIKRGHRYVPAHLNGPTAGVYPCCPGHGGSRAGIECGPGMLDNGYPGMPSILHGIDNGSEILAPPPRVLPSNGSPKSPAPTTGKGLSLFRQPSYTPAHSPGRNQGSRPPVVTAPSMIPVEGSRTQPAHMTQGMVEFGSALEIPDNPPTLGPANPLMAPIGMPVVHDLQPPMPQATFGPAQQGDNP